MDKYEIESKLYLTPTKGRLRLKTLLNLILVGLAISTFFYIIVDGFSINKIGKLCLAILVLSNFNLESKPKYQFSILNLEIYRDKVDFLYNAIKIGSYTGVVRYEVSVNNIDKIEYSKQLNAIRFTGKINRFINKKAEIVNDLVVYCQEETKGVINAIENNLNCKVDWKDN